MAIIDINILVNRICEGGELFYYVIQRKTLSEREAAMIMK